MGDNHQNSLPAPFFIRGNINSRIAVYRYSNRESTFPPVIMTHGTFSNAQICAKLASYLNANGFDCWVYEWSGHGLSRYGDLCPDVEDFALNDVPKVIERVLAETKRSSCIWVAHSGGGFLPLIHMARNLQDQGKISAIAGIGSQTAGAGRSLIGKVITRAVPMVDQILGRVPGPLFGLGPEDEVSGFLKQWSRWNRTGKWIGNDGFDYFNAMGNIHIPTLVISGSKDLIAPPNGCRQLVQSLGSSQKTFVECSKATGYKEDYNHPRLIASRNAQAEIWPIIINFISAHP